MGEKLRPKEMSWTPQDAWAPGEWDSTGQFQASCASYSFHHAAYFEDFSSFAFLSFFSFLSSFPPSFLICSLFIKKIQWEKIVRPWQHHLFFGYRFWQGYKAGPHGRACKEGWTSLSHPHSQGSPGLSELLWCEGGNTAPTTAASTALDALLAFPYPPEHSLLKDTLLAESLSQGVPCLPVPWKSGISSEQRSKQRGWNPSASWEWILVMDRDTELRNLVSTMWCEWETTIL